MHDCPCCGQPTYGVRELCDVCVNGCDPAASWHCFTGQCDGSGCTYPGECEIGRDDRAYWDDLYA